jgi:hypothetical protein
MVLPEKDTTLMKSMPGICAGEDAFDGITVLINLPACGRWSRPGMAECNETKNGFGDHLIVPPKSLGRQFAGRQPFVHVRGVGFIIELVGAFQQVAADLISFLAPKRKRDFS